jgi:hypothetical protein
MTDRSSQADLEAVYEGLDAAEAACRPEWPALLAAIAQARATADARRGQPDPLRELTMSSGASVMEVIAVDLTLEEIAALPNLTLLRGLPGRDADADADAADAVFFLLDTPMPADPVFAATLRRLGLTCADGLSYRTPDSALGDELGDPVLRTIRAALASGLALVKVDVADGYELVARQHQGESAHHS